MTFTDIHSSGVAFTLWGRNRDREPAPSQAQGPATGGTTGEGPLSQSACPRTSCKGSTFLTDAAILLSARGHAVEKTNRCCSLQLYPRLPSARPDLVEAGPRSSTFPTQPRHKKVSLVSLGIFDADHLDSLEISVASLCNFGRPWNFLRFLLADQNGALLRPNSVKQRFVG